MKRGKISHLGLILLTNLSKDLQRFLLLTFLSEFDSASAKNVTASQARPRQMPRRGKAGIGVGKIVLDRYKRVLICYFIIHIWVLTCLVCVKQNCYSC